MPKNTHTYSAHGGSHTGTSGFTNHWPGSTEQVARALKRVFADHGDVVVLDGNDDWYAYGCNRPEEFEQIFGITPVAWFHTGISGIAKSGIVVTREDFERIEREFPTKEFTAVRREPVTGRVLRKCVRVYEAP